MNCPTEYVLYMVLILLIAIGVYMYLSKNGSEHFSMYKRNPYEYYETGGSPLNFYEFPIYRKPYMYPQQFYKSYPIPHLSHYEDALTAH